MTKKIDKKMKIGVLDEIRHFKSLSLDIKTYTELFELSKNIGTIPMSIADVVRLLLAEYKNNQITELQQQSKIAQKFLQNKSKLLINNN